MKNLILPAADAQATYAAMCALNAVGARLDAAPARSPKGEGIRVTEHITGVVTIYCDGVAREVYPDQAAFAAAYGLPVAAPDLVAALRVAYSDIQRLPGHTIDMLGRIEAALDLSAA